MVRYTAASMVYSSDFACRRAIFCPSPSCLSPLSSLSSETLQLMDRKVCSCVFALNFVFVPLDGASTEC